MVASGTSAVDHLHVAARVHAGDATAATVEVADHVAHVVLGHDDFNRHHGFEQMDAGLFARASWNAIDAATSNAGPDESTSWYAAVEQRRLARR